MAGLAEFISRHGGPEVHLIPLHGLGGNKYPALGIPDPMSGWRRFTREEVQRIQGKMMSLGLQVHII